MRDLICPHCGKTIRLASDGQLLEAEETAPRPAPRPSRRESLSASASGMDAFAGAFKRKPAAATSQPGAPDAPPTLSRPAHEAVPEPATPPMAIAARTDAVPAAVIPADSKPRPALADVPNLLDALARDPSLNPGQRETLRLIYVRFAPQAIPGAGSEPLDLGVVLEQDPNLNEGQRETLRLVYRRFKRR